MKIVMTGYHNPSFETVTEYTERALKELGHVLLSFDDRSFILPGRIRSRVPWLHYLELWLLNRRVLDLVRKSRPDLLFISGGNRIFQSTISAVRSMKVKTALWTIDAPVDFEPIAAVASVCDRIFCGGTEAIEVLGKKGCTGMHWLPFACEPATHKPVQLTEEEKRHWGGDIAFVGSMYDNRMETLTSITDMNFKFWGPGWNKKLAPNHPLRKNLQGGQLRPDEWIKVLSASKIVLIVHYQDGTIPCYQASPKFYETLACNAFALVDKQKDVFSLFKDKEHCVGFENNEDLKRKVHYYLEHPEERCAIADKGRRTVLEKHTYVHRMKEMIRCIE